MRHPAKHCGDEAKTGGNVLAMSRRYFVQSALNRDYTVAMGTVLFYSVLLMLLTVGVMIAVERTLGLSHFVR